MGNPPVSMYYSSLFLCFLGLIASGKSATFEAKRPLIPVLIGDDGTTPIGPRPPLPSGFLGPRARPPVLFDDDGTTPIGPRPPVVIQNEEITPLVLDPVLIDEDITPIVYNFEADYEIESDYDIESEREAGVTYIPEPTAVPVPTIVPDPVTYIPEPTFITEPREALMMGLMRRQDQQGCEADGDDRCSKYSDSDLDKYCKDAKTGVPEVCCASCK